MRIPFRRIARLAVLQLVAAFVLFELGLRWIYDGGHGLQNVLYMPGVRSAFEDADDLPELLRLAGLAYAPFEVVGDFKLNSRGLRTPECGLEPAPGVRRIVALGDSFTWASGGVPYDTLWHRVVGRELARRAEVEVEVVNLGIPSVGPDFEERMWELEGARLSPDLVLHALFIGNDFIDLRGSLADQDALDTLARHSYAVRLVRNLLLLRRARWSQGEDAAAEVDEPDEGLTGGYVLPERSKRYRSDRSKFSRETHRRIVFRRLVVCERDRAEAFDAACGRIGEILRELQRAVTAAGGRYVVILIPDEFQTDRELRDEVLDLYDLESEDYDWERPQRALVEILEREGIEYLDLLPVLRDSTPGTTFRKHGTHWNIQGNAIAAEALLEDLARRGVIDAWKRAGG